MLRLISYLAPSIPAGTIRASRVLSPPIKAAVRKALLGAHAGFGSELRFYGFTRFVDPVASDYVAA